MDLKNILIGITLSLSTISCIQDEALNIEAAIDGCSGTNIQLININEISREIDIFVLLKKSVPSLSHPKMEVTRQLIQLIYTQ